MDSTQKLNTILDEVLISKIHFIRQQKVMVDSDLAELYGVENRVLKQAVKRNSSRFPEDFMFELTNDEHSAIKPQKENGKRGQHSKYSSFAFTEHGVLMLSSVLKSERAIEVNIQIMRIYTRLKEILLTHKDLLLKVEQIEQELTQQGKSIQLVFDYLNQFIKQQDEPRKVIGYRTER